MANFKGFTSVELRKPQRSWFDHSHEKRISTRMGKLTPIFVSEALPNDTFKCNSEVMLRLAPLLAPIMHRVNVYVHYFFVPNRLLWKDWEAFITNGRLGTETPPLPPYTNITNIQARAKSLLDQKSIADFFGCGTITDAAAGYTSVTIDLMPFAAHYKIWYDFYRDRNYVADDTILPLPSGSTSTAATLDALMDKRFRDWEKEYFTSALPWTQRGNEVLMPMIGTGDVVYMPVSEVVTQAGGLPAANTLVGVDAAAQPNFKINKASAAGAGVAGRIENIDMVNITGSSVSINDLRQAVRLQEWMERNALAGSRYNESIMAHFGRKTSDSRLQRAEYLGGGKVAVKISEVVTTAYSSDGTDIVPPANMSGHGISFGNTNRFTYNCEEHGFVIGYLSVMPVSSYMQGSKRMFFGRNTFLDYVWPSFAHLGEQEVYKYELYQDPVNTPIVRSTQPVFGYQSRYSDWKYTPSSSHGDFKGNLDFWHLTRKFASNPTLGATFCTFEDTLQDRVFAVSGVDTLWCYIYNQCHIKRSLPYFGTPML